MTNSYKISTSTESNSETLNNSSKLTVQVESNIIVLQKLEDKLKNIDSKNKKKDFIANTPKNNNSTKSDEKNNLNNKDLSENKNFNNNNLLLEITPLSKNASKIF